MGNLLFSPEGRINSAQFYRGGFVLILIMTAITLTNLVNQQLGQVMGFLAYLLLYPWAVVWIKRLHNGGKSGWMFLVYLLLYFILSTIGFIVVMTYFGNGNFIELVMQSVNGDITDAELETKMYEWTKSITIPSTISSIITSVATMFIGDKTIPTDYEDNQYGVGDNTFD